MQERILKEYVDPTQGVVVQAYDQGGFKGNMRVRVIFTTDSFPDTAKGDGEAIRYYNGMVEKVKAHKLFAPTKLICWDCKTEIEKNDEVWIDPVTTKATTSDEGKPYHVMCAPNEIL
jgi:hypothetical protein